MQAPGQPCPLAWTAVVPQDHFAAWKPRVQQIYLAELTAVPLMLARHANLFRGEDALFFVDNEGALAALVRGGSGEADAEAVAHIVHSLATILNCRIWWGWVDSASNPADCMSRVGLAADPVRTGTWSGELFTNFPFWSEKGCPWKTAQALLDYNWEEVIAHEETYMEHLAAPAESRSFSSSPAASC